MPDQARIRFGCGQLWPLRPAGIGPDPICRIHIGCYFPALEVARIRIRSVFVHPACFRYLCVMPDPLGLNKARSDPPPATRIRTTSGISIPGRMVIDRSESVLFSTSGLPPILMRYAGSAWPEQSQIRPASSETGPDHIRHFYSGSDGHRPIRIGSVFLHLACFRY